MVIFKNSGFPLSMDMFPINGTQASWTEMSFPLKKPLLTPDTVLIAFASGNPDENNTAGNYMMIDDVTFVGSTSQISNNGFEKWTEFSYEDPEGWTSLNSFVMLFGGVPNVTKSTDAYDGDYAVSVKTALFGDMSDPDTIGFIATSSLENIESGGGFPLASGKPDSLVFWYQYKPSQAKDKGVVMMMMTKFNSTMNKSDVVDSQFVYVNATNGYTRGSITFNSTGTAPDSR